ncbi:MAG: hypothetical protein QNJ72_30545 [Pleurocapsa sp. MO_226.B13]|nr:hypothetical protein [Pleurocapsa sp. MO_226.B13]
MSKDNLRDNKQAIATAFQQLLHQYRQGESKIATKEEEAEKNKNKQLLNKTMDYTVDNIINGMASLQLSFGTVVGELTENLTAESDKLEELKKAIAVETEHLQQLNQVRLVADALYILDREHQEKLSSIQAQTKEEKEVLEKEILQTKKEWSKEQKQFETKIEEAAQLIIKQREAEQADYQYELERQRTIENDEYEENKRLQARELTEQEALKNKDWSEREKYLADHKKEYLKNKEQIEGFETKLKEEYNKAKGNAIKEADSKYKVQAELKEKEWLANQRGYELKIESLTAVIERQTQQIAEITAQLQEVNTQAQNLAMQAFQ